MLPSRGAVCSLCLEKTWDRRKARHYRFLFRPRSPAFPERDPERDDHGNIPDLRLTQTDQRGDAVDGRRGTGYAAADLSIRQEQRDHDTDRQLRSGIVRGLRRRLWSGSLSELHQRSHRTCQLIRCARNSPGQTVVLWGTGLGPVTFPDNVAPTAGNVSTPVTATDRRTTRHRRSIPAARPAAPESIRS